MTDRIEPRADRKTWMIIIAYLLVSVFVNGSSRQMSLDMNETVGVVWLYEISSHIMIPIAGLIVPVWLSKYPLSVENWRRRIPAYFAGFLCFALIHILGMMLIRKLAFPLLFGKTYNENLLTLEPWIYELRIDFMTFILVLSAFLTSRQLAQLRLEADAARQDARTSGRITLKSGGRLIFLQAEEILYAKAAGNYIEVFTSGGMHLVRMTMSSLENLLSEAGCHLRVHRSYLVRQNAISEMKPNGDGEAIIFVPNEVQIPVSRKYRKYLESFLKV